VKQSVRFLHITRYSGLWKGSMQKNLAGLVNKLAGQQLIYVVETKSYENVV